MTTLETAPAAPPAPPTAEERAAAGKAARGQASRASHGEWEPSADRPDPIELLEEQASTREPSLVPIRYGRMSASPFAFYRGAAYILASDLANTPDSGIRAQLCGDAHLSNFGGFASPERELVFDLNDFDETLPGPWEWDVKRLAASIEVAARGRGFPAKHSRRMVARALQTYRETVREFASMRTLDAWYTHASEKVVGAEFEEHLSPEHVRRFEKVVAKAKAKDSTRAYNKLATSVNGSARILPDPPLITPVEDLTEADPKEIEGFLCKLIDDYSETLANDRRHLLKRFHYVHAARKVVGVGSVGTRAWVLLMLGRDDGDPLFLQAKEAQRSVLAGFVGESEYENQGQRVVEGQRLTQASSDIFLGWFRTVGIDGNERDFYVRQLWDWKTSADLETLEPEVMTRYAGLCGWTLARAHARSGDAVAIGAYLGAGDSFDKAVTRFASAYADQNERDHRALLDAIDSGRIKALKGL